MFQSKILGVNGIKITALLVALGAAPSAWARSGGDGGAFNGPNLSGQSIPVEMERGITRKQARDAMKACVAGDGSSGSVSLMDRIYQQAFGKPRERHQAILNAVEFYDTYSTPPAGRVTFRSSVWFGSRGNIRSVLSASVNTDGRAGDLSVMVCLNESPNETGCPDEVNRFDVIAGVAVALIAEIPYLSYDSVNKESSFDDWGREVSERHILQGVRIQLPKEYGSAVPTINRTTGKKSKLTLNLVEYAECLNAELQRRAIQ